MKKFLILLFAALSLTTNAKVQLPPLMGDNMVLQRNTDVKIWGSAAPNSNVTVTPSWSNSPVNVKADKEGKFVANVATGDAGGPFEITVTDKDGAVKIQNVLLGEVWFCAGQSNMEMPMRGFSRQPLTGTNDVIARAKASTPIRMFISDSKNGEWVRQFSKTPLETNKGAWFENTPENVANTSAAAYFFAQYLQDVLDVPVGIMVSTLGGSRIEPWLSREVIEKNHPDISLAVLDNDGEVKQHSDPCVLFNAKVYPFLNYAIRGMLWYQGESNRDNADIYDDLMAEMVADYRDRWDVGEFPFYFVEIAPYDYNNPKDTDAAKLREAQSRAAKKIPNSGIASTLDIGNYNFIHPTNKKTVGDRLAWLALADTYGIKGFGSQSPVYESMEVKDGKIYINVINAERGLCPMWTSLTGFEIAGEDQVFHPAFAEIETKSCRLAVSSPEVPNPVAVRYCYQNTPECSVYNTHGLPLLPFRTDNWNK